MITPPPSDAAGQVLHVVNSARAAHGLPLFVASTALTEAAADHTRRMATGCGVSHRCRDERALTDRETARDVTWHACSENAAAGGPSADTREAVAATAKWLAEGMLAERPPADGHRANILSRAFHRVGIAVTRAPSGLVYLTEDFAD
jgi:uncharacterized protein YkwD